MRTPSLSLNLADVEAAQARIAGGIRRTPCIRMPDLPELGGIEVWLKRDDMQRTRSFKERGALNALLSLSGEEKANGVIAASAGNHGLGLAYHGSRLRIRVTIVMPTEASAVKIGRCRSLGAEVVLYGRSFDEAQQHSEMLSMGSSLTLVHPFDDFSVIAGQGTMALEIANAAHQFDAIVVPVGGGGLLAGTATVCKTLRPGARVIAVQAENAQSLKAACRHGRPTPVQVGSTLADGIAVACVGRTSFAIASRLLDDIVTVTEGGIAEAINLLARNGVVAEGAGAAGLAAVMSGKLSARSVVVPVSGGNIEARRHEKAVADGAEIRRREVRAA